MRALQIASEIAVTEIPVEFGIDLPLSLPIKIQPLKSMKKAPAIAEKPLIPALFQIAACADEAKYMSRLKGVLALGRTPLSEMMLNPDKVEEILNGIAQRKKTAPRRSVYDRFYKSIV